MRSSGGMRSISIAQRKDSNGKALLAGAGAGAVANTTGASTPVLMTCPPEDKTFMCKLARFYNIFKMILGILVTVIVIGVLLWYGWKLFKSRPSGKKSGGGCGCESKSWMFSS